MQHEELLIPTSKGKDALKHAIRAAELYMKALQGERVPAERLRLQQKAEEALTLGEYLKAESIGPPIPAQQPRQVTPREAVALLQSSKLHGNRFLPWLKSHCNPKVFALEPGKRVYRYV